MTTRLLPREEWHRLAGTELGEVVSSLNDACRIVVVEDDTRIVACWAVIPTVHVEGLWISPTVQSLGVARRLWRGMVDAARSFGVSSVITYANSDRVRGLLDRAHATPIPCDSYVLPLGDR